MDQYIKLDDALNASQIAYIEYLRLGNSACKCGEAEEIPVVFKRDLESLPTVSLPEQTQWILTTDYLPEEDGKYLVVIYACGIAWVNLVSFAANLEKVDQDDFEGDHRPGFYSYDPEFGYFERDLNSIVCWMPVPTVPEHLVADWYAARNAEEESNDG